MIKLNLSQCKSKLVAKCKIEDTIVMMHLNVEVDFTIVYIRECIVIYRKHFPFEFECLNLCYQWLHCTFIRR